MCDIRPVVMQITGKNHCIPCYYKSLATASNHRTISVHVKINSVHVATTNVRHLQRRQNIRWRQILTAKPVQNKRNHSKCTNSSNIHAHIGVTHANANGNGVGSFNDDSEPTCISQQKWNQHAFFSRNGVGVCLYELHPWSNRHSDRLSIYLSASSTNWN